LYDALTTVDIRYTADVVSTLMQSRSKMTSGSPNEYIAALEQAIWFGSVDAKRLAIKEISRFKYRPAMLPIIDSAIEYPVLNRQVITALGKLGDARARFFLDGHLRGKDPILRKQAAECLATIGGNAIETLREAISSNEDDIRHAAIEALVPHTTLNDLTILHEYAYMHPEDDPKILALVRDRAILLETLMEQGIDEAADPYGVTPE
jgi:HEAT repeat protein